MDDGRRNGGTREDSRKDDNGRDDGRGASRRTDHRDSRDTPGEDRFALRVVVGSRHALKSRHRLPAGMPRDVAVTLLQHSNLFPPHFSKPTMLRSPSSPLDAKQAHIAP